MLTPPRRSSARAASGSTSSGRPPSCRQTPSDPAAREHLTRAVELADETDATGHRAELRLEVAESLSSEERGEAISLVREALDLARAKGAVVVERRAEELLARLSG